MLLKRWVPVGMVHFKKRTSKFGVEGQHQEAVLFVERGPETLLPEGNLIKRAFFFRKRLLRTAVHSLSTLSARDCFLIWLRPLELAEKRTLLCRDPCWPDAGGTM